jgi:hypothetical protein
LSESTNKRRLTRRFALPDRFTEQNDYTEPNDYAEQNWFAEPKAFSKSKDFEFASARRFKTRLADPKTASAPRFDHEAASPRGIHPRRNLRAKRVFINAQLRDDSTFMTFA